MNEKNQKGEITYDNGDIYTGHIINGIPNGQGTYIFNDGGDKFEGTFKNGEMNGNGKHIAKFGIYEGNFKDGLKHGEGCYYSDYFEDQKNMFAI